MKRPSTISILTLLGMTASLSAATGELEINVIDSHSKEPLGVRMELKNSKARFIRPKNAIKSGNSFVFDGKFVLKLATGSYTFRMEHGPEYKIRSGNFTIERGAADNKTVEMVRYVDMSKEGWYSGDLFFQHPKNHWQSLMRAEDLNVGMVSPSAVQKSEITPIGSPRQIRTLSNSINNQLGHIIVAATTGDFGPNLQDDQYPWNFLTSKDQRVKAGQHVNLARASHWDLPVWIASRQLDSIGVLDAAGIDVASTTKRRQTTNGRAPDPVIYAPPLGQARWSLDIYYKLLNAGFRIPPTASTASGKSRLPLGYNRVYVHCGQDFSYENWWANLEAGKCIVTNGPMLRPLVNGKPPGTVFSGYSGQSVELDIELKLSTREKISYLEIIKNGTSVEEVRLAEFAKAKGQLPVIRFDQSGWLLVRAICDDARRYRYAMSAPYYVSFESQPRISKNAVEFFLNWAQVRESMVEKSKDPSERKTHRFHQGAVRFWQKRLQRVNAE